MLRPGKPLPILRGNFCGAGEIFWETGGVLNVEVITAVGLVVNPFELVTFRSVIFTPRSLFTDLLRQISERAGEAELVLDTESECKRVLRLSSV